jgi:hypothetical protein
VYRVEEQKGGWGEAESTIRVWGLARNSRGCLRACKVLDTARTVNSFTQQNLSLGPGIPTRAALALMCGARGP